MIIKNFSKKRDLEYLKSTFIDLYKFNGLKISKKDIPKIEENILLCIGKKYHKVFVGFVKNKPIGFMEVTIQKYDKQKKVVIRKIYINEKERKKGYSKLLINKAKEFAQQYNIDEINLNTFPINYQIYKKLGFEPVSYWMELKIK